MKKILLLLSCLSTSVFAQYFEHKDWEIACDNTRTCRVAGYSKEDDDLRMSVLFTRLAGQNQPITAKITLSDIDENNTDRAILLINGKPLRTLSFAKTSDLALTSAETQQLLEAIKSTGKVQLTANKQTATLSNEGANAVLLKMDDVQGRVGTTSAIIKKGNKTQVLPALPVPVVKSQPINTNVKNIKIDEKAFLKDAVTEKLKDECMAESYEPTVEAILNKDKLLISTRCLEGAYNFSNAYWIINKQKPYQPKLINTEADDLSGNQLSSDQKGRGVGDCWSHDTWTWDGQTFAHTSSWDTGMCRAIHAGGTWELPTIVTKVK